MIFEMLNEYNYVQHGFELFVQIDLLFTVLYLKMFTAPLDE